MTIAKLYLITTPEEEIEESIELASPDNEFKEEIILVNIFLWKLLYPRPLVCDWFVLHCLLLSGLGPTHWWVSHSILRMGIFLVSVLFFIYFFHLDYTPNWKHISITK